MGSGMTPIYKKRGRQYVEIGRHDPEATDYLPGGSHLVIVGYGTKTTVYNVPPDDAAIEAALHRVRIAMTEAMHEATKLKPEKRRYTETEIRAIEAYRAIAGDPIALRYEGVSMADVIDSAIKVLRDEVKK